MPSPLMDRSPAGLQLRWRAIWRAFPPKKNYFLLGGSTITPLPVAYQPLKAPQIMQEFEILRKGTSWPMPGACTFVGTAAHTWAA
jgi:hypothetical protein